MQTETPLYVTDVLGEIDNPETAVIEPAPVRQAPRRGPALFVADRRRAAKRDSEHGNFFEWLALGILAAVIVALLAGTNIGTYIADGAKQAITKIVGAGDGAGKPDYTKFTDKGNCTNGGGQWKDNKCQAPAK